MPGSAASDGMEKQDKRKEGRAMAEKIRRKELFGGVEIEAIYRETRRPAPQAGKKVKEGKEENWDGLEEKTLEGAGFGFCPPLNPRTYLAEDGILCEQDVAVTLRDGIVIYTRHLPPRWGRPISPPSSHGVISANVRATALTNGRSSGSRRERFPGWPSSSPPTRLTGAGRAMPSPTWTPAASAIPRAT